MAEYELPMRNHLLIRDWRMFELYAGMDLRDCGGTVMADSVGEYCVDGEYRRATYNEDTYSLDPPAGVDDSQSPTGTTFRMKDFLVYFPVGADVQSVEPQNQTAAASNHPDWLFSRLFGEPRRCGGTTVISDMTGNPPDTAGGWMVDMDDTTDSAKGLRPLARSVSVVVSCCRLV